MCVDCCTNDFKGHVKYACANGFEDQLFPSCDLSSYFLEEFRILLIPSM